MAKKKQKHPQMQKRPKSAMELGWKKSSKSRLRSIGDVDPLHEVLAEAHFDDMFGETEPLRGKLIAELIEMGWDEKLLKQYKRMGLAYSRKRNSFVEA